MGAQKAPSTGHHSEPRRGVDALTMRPVRPWREFWVLMALGFAQLCLTGVFQTVVPFAYLSHVSREDPQVARQLVELQKAGEQDAAQGAPSTPEEIEARGRVMAPLFEKVPWGRMGWLASLLIYPLLGRMSGRYLSRPESGGLLILISAGLGQNPATIPMSLQYSGMGQVALPLSEVISLILFQFFALGAGIFSAPEVKKTLEKGKLQ